jgi:glycosyltransferase involved in cell wall biosynthesis
LPFPNNAGQRKRVLQFIDILKANDCGVTLLHFAVEIPHIWSDHLGLEKQTRELVDDLIIYYPKPNIWAGPANGQAHQLDEWIEANFLETLTKLFQRRFYDFVVVNNVWMSKVFDVIPKATIKILETHDIFHERQLAFASIGKPPDFFTCNRTDEIFGWNRSDIVIGITNKETMSIARSSTKIKSINVPYLEDFEGNHNPGYLHSDKVTFGFMGSGHPFNIHGIKDLIHALKDFMPWAPMELIIAGDVGNHLSEEEKKYVIDLGYIKNVDDFYKSIDICVSPLDFGSGLKIKVIEAISKGVPLISTKHSAAGSDLLKTNVCENVKQLGQKMFDITISRPSFSELQKLTTLAYKLLTHRFKQSLAELLNSITALQKHIVISYSALEISTSDIKFWVLLSLIREASYRYTVTLDLPNSSSEPGWVSRLPPNVRLSCNEQTIISNESRPRVDLSGLFRSEAKVIVLTDNSAYKAPNNVKKVCDSRFSKPFESRYLIKNNHITMSTDDSIFEVMPCWSSSIVWDPILPRIPGMKSANIVILTNKELGKNLLDAIKMNTQNSSAHQILLKESFSFGHLEQIKSINPSVILNLTENLVGELLFDWCNILNIKYVKSKEDELLNSAIDLKYEALNNPSQKWDAFFKFIMDKS